MMTLYYRLNDNNLIKNHRSKLSNFLRVRYIFCLLHAIFYSTKKRSKCALLGLGKEIYSIFAASETQT